MSTTIYTVYWLRDQTHTDVFKEGYVGITSRKPELRLHEHLNTKDWVPNSYAFDILHQVDTKTEVVSLEKSYRPIDGIGWNIAKGGGSRPTGIHTSGWYHSEEAKEQRRIDSMGEKNGMYGKTQTDRQKEAVRVANSVPKPHVSKNMKRLHEEGNTYTFDKRDHAKGGATSQAKNPKWFTDGKTNKYCPVGEEPSGFSRGRTTGWKTHPKKS